MELTIHGLERIQNRTSMFYKNVIQLIEKKCVVALGSSRDSNCEYLLFYSIPDQEVRIAVVTGKGNRVITILHPDMDPYDPLEREISPESIYEARYLASQCFPERFVEGLPPAEPHPWTVLVDVFYGEANEREHILQERAVLHLGGCAFEVEEYAIGAMDELFKEVAKKVRKVQKRKWIPNIQYFCSLSSAHLKRPKIYSVTHKHVMSRLVTTTD